MTEETKEIIEETVNETVLKLKMAGLLKENRRTAIEKLEELLKNYPKFTKIKGKPDTEKLVERVQEALMRISSDPYFEVIELFYFEGYTREYIAHRFDTTVTTISRNKTRLLKELVPELFSDEFIFELFL
jgi:DNA-directed RNA polymerase specialized sigma subunit